MRELNDLLYEDVGSLQPAEILEVCIYRAQVIKTYIDDMVATLESRQERYNSGDDVDLYDLDHNVETISEEAQQLYWIIENTDKLTHEDTI